MKKKAKKTKLGRALIKGLKEASARNLFVEGLPANRGEWLSLCAKITKKVIKDHQWENGTGMVEQFNRLALELQAWKIANPSEAIRDKFNY